jgi:hypothetical protein
MPSTAPFRGMSRAWAFACLLACLFACVACRTGSRGQWVARDVLAWPVTRVTIQLAGHAWVEFETRNESDGALPVLHLWDGLARSEVARASAVPWLRRSAKLRYQNPHPEPRSYELLVRARSAKSRAALDLVRDGRVIGRRVSAGGALLALARGPGLEYRVASTPGGPRAATLWALDADSRLLAVDEHSGPTKLPRLRSDRAVSAVLLAPGSARPGRFSVYVNDKADADGDGLGRSLERALGTCDGPDEPGCARSPLAAYYRKLPTSTRDTDRDGLSDADELFGVSAPELDLPRFGTDPRHKDVLLEIDHQADMESVGFTERELADVAALFGAGSAHALRNPDGLPGVRVHFDAGLVTRSPALRGVVGDFGGSGSARDADYRAARQRDFTPSRVGYFRYVLSTRSGRGQAVRDALTVNRDLQRVTILAHELGHTLGLGHHGHDAWGRVNCKPNYYSIMNYLYQNRYEIGFSRRTAQVLNPASVSERSALARGEPAAALRNPPLELDVFGRDVDWNRDGVISDGPVRAGLLWATYKSCAAAEHGLVTLAERDVGTATPVLLRDAQQLVALWLDDAGQLWWRKRRVIEADFEGACATAAAPGCEWSAPEALPGLKGLRHIAGLALSEGRLLLSYVREAGALRLAVLQSAGGAAAVLSDVALPGRTEHAPSLGWLAVDERYYGVNRILALIFRAAGSGEIWQVGARDSGGPFVARRLLDPGGASIASARGPSFASLPSGETCGVFPDREAFMRFYCYAPERDAWLDLSQRAFDAPLGPQTSGSVGMALHRYRDLTGAAIGGDSSRAALYLSFTEPESSSAHYPDNPHFLVSEWLSATHAAREQISFRWRGSVITEWTNLAPGTALALYEDAGLANLHALMALRHEATHTTRLELLPFADGIFDQPLAAGNDFEVMERGICMGLRSELECGDASTAAY